MSLPHHRKSTQLLQFKHTNLFSSALLSSQAQWTFFFIVFFSSFSQTVHTVHLPITAQCLPAVISSCTTGVSLTSLGTAPWTSSISPLYSWATHSHSANLESQPNQTCMTLNCRRKPEYLERIHADAGRACKLHRRGSLMTSMLKPDTLFLCDSVNYRSTVLP